MVDSDEVQLVELVVTAPDSEWLHQFTRQLVEERLASNVHNFAPVRSTYRWEGRVHERSEGRAALHTRRSLIPAIVRLARECHPYLVPSISARAIVDGNPDYLEWIKEATE